MVKAGGEQSRGGVSVAFRRGWQAARCQYTLQVIIVVIVVIIIIIIIVIIVIITIITTILIANIFGVDGKRETFIWRVFGKKSFCGKIFFGLR